MKALLVATTFPRWPRDPGPAPFVFQLAKHLAARLPLLVLAPHFPGAAKQEDLEGVPVRRFRYLWPEGLETLADGQGLQNHLRQSFRARLEALPFLLGELLALRRLLATGEFSAVNAHWLVPSGALAALLKKFYRFRLVLTAHAADVFLLLRTPGGKRLLRWIVGRADLVFCVSEALAAGMTAATGPSAKFKVLPMGADLKLFAPAPSRAAVRERLGLEPGFLILFVGKLTEKKGVTFLLQALAKLQSDQTSPRLLIIGEGALRAELMAEAGRLGLSERVRFLGAKPQVELADYYRAADLVVVPSVRDRRGETEGMPVVLLEALASGAPVIATPLCGAPEALKGKGVIVVPSANAAALAEAIAAAERHPPKVDLSAVQAFAWPEIARQYAEALFGQPS